VTARVWPGELLRWYLTRARHPFKGYVTGHYWWLFVKMRVWVRYDDDRIINVGLGEYIQQRIFFDRYYERPLIEWLKRTLSEGDVFWDVGANIGAVTLVAAKCSGRVVAFEPDPRSFSRLTQHVEINGIDNVTLVNAALNETSGQASLTQAGETNTGMSSMIPDRAAATTAVTVQTITADEYLLEQPAWAPSVMKIDVEGAEHLVLRGARTLLRSAKLRAVVFEDRHDEHRRPTNRELINCLRDAGFRIDPLGLSEPQSNDGMYNFLATRVR
jgi:FkbM family methyltransferase